MSVLIVAFVSLLFFGLTADTALGQDCYEERREHCAGVGAADETDEFALRSGHVLEIFPRLTVSGTGVQPSGAYVVDNPVGQDRFQVKWHTGILSCIHYTVYYCDTPR